MIIFNSQYNELVEYDVNKIVLFYGMSKCKTTSNMLKIISIRNHNSKSIKIAQ